MEKYSGNFVKVSEPHSHVLLIELARAPVNAFSQEFWKEYGTLFQRLIGDGADVRAAVLSSVFPKTFTAGLDLTDASSLAEPRGDSEQDGARASLAIRNKLQEFQHMIGAPERTPFPVIAAVHGHVVGLGVDMIAVCDIRYAAADSKFCIKEVDIGLAPDIGSLAFLPKITGNHSLLRELTYTARTFTAEEAFRLGLVSKVVPGGRDEVIREALSLANVIAGKSPIAVAGSKHLITHARDHSVADNLAYTCSWSAAALITQDIRENLRATKLGERPKFSALSVSSKL